MKLVYGDQVVENASVVIEPSRLCHHDEPGRIKQLIELTVPADVSNGGYAVRQLLGQDPDIGAKSVVTLEVALTQQQIEKLKTITEDELRDIRNGVNPAMIYGVRVYDSEPMDVEEFITGKKWPKWFTPSKTLKDATGSEIICFRRDSENSGHTFCVGGKHYSWHEWKGDGLQLEEITEPEAQAIIAHSVKPTGEYLGCVQWFQHQNPSVIVRRDSHDRCTYFEHDSEPVSGLAWHESFTAWVKSGEWTEITQQEAESRIAYNRKFAGLTAQEPQPGMCKREQFAGGGAPSPRNCDVCLEGPCPRVIPVQCGDDSDPALKALRTLAQQSGFDPAGMSPKDIADQLGAVIKPAEQAATNESEMLEFPVEQVDVPRVGIDELRWADAGDIWNPVCSADAWQSKIWAARKNEFRIRCLPQHLPPARNAVEPKPIPRNIPNLAFVGIDWAKRPDITATVVVTTDPGRRIVELTMQSVLTPGVWVVAFDDKSHMLLEINQERTLEAPVPAARISGPIGVKLPVQFRTPAMPKDYGRKVYFREDEYELHDLKTGVLKGYDEDQKVYMVSVEGERTRYLKHRQIWTIDEPTDGF